LGLISAVFFYILSKKTGERRKFLATSKSKHTRKKNQFRLKGKRRKEKAKKAKRAAAASPKTPKGGSA